MLKPLKKIFLFLFLLAVIISAIGLFLFSKNLTPYKLVLAANPKPVQNYDKIFFHDLNRDGKSERFVVFNRNKVRDVRHINIYDQEEGLMNQWNFADSLLLDYLFFKDLNNDGSDEIVIWTQKQNSLFLNIIDVRNNRRLANHAFVLKSPGPFPLGYWDIQNIKVAFDTDKNNQLRFMYFAISSGYSLRPRGIYLFDLKEHRILKHSPVKASVTNLQPVDMDNDGTNELLFSSYATANFPPNENFTDQKAWLILFNQNLDILHSTSYPKAFSSVAAAYPFKNHKKQYIATVINLPYKILFSVLDKDFHRTHSKIFYFNLIALFVDTKNELFTFYGKTSNFVKIYTVDYDLNIIKQKSKPSLSGTNYQLTFDFDHDNRPNFFIATTGYFALLDENFNILAQKSYLRPQGISVPTFNWRHGEKLPQLSINSTLNNYLYNLKPNPLYSYLYYYFIVTFILLSLLFFVGHLLINRLRIYLSYFLFSLKDSDNAIVLLNHKGAILSFNQKVKSMLQLKATLKKNQSFNDVFGGRTDIYSAIEKTLTNQIPLKQEISFEDAHSTFIGEISITPFFSFFKFANAYLVEIKDSTRQVLSDRHSNWQRTVRKMVHDIKNPLGGVQLKLQSIYMRLSDAYPEAAKELQEELETANAEIKRIRNISKDFLKFSDLDKPQFKRIPIKPFINRIVQHFDAFRNTLMSIHIDFGSNLPDKILMDEHQIEMLLHILIENAIDAVKGRGAIDIHLDLVQCLQNPQQQSFEIRITDDGPGIAAEYQDKIFEPHFSTKKEGTGMGLVFAKHIVRQHGGNINFKSSIGTSFIVKLPLTDRQ